MVAENGKNQVNCKYFKIVLEEMYLLTDDQKDARLKKTTNNSK